MRIALLGTRGVPAQYGGFETAAEEIGRRLAERGHEVIVYCRNPGQVQTEYLGMHLVNLPAVRARAAETLSHTMASAGHALARSHPDVVFMFNAANAPFLPPLRLGRIPVAVHVDGLEWQRGKWGRRASAYYRWAEARSARWADAVIADAHGIVDHMQAVHGVRSWYIPYGAPILSPAPGRLADLGLEARNYHLVVARFEPENHVLEIVTGYVSSGCQMPLVVVGDAPYAADYRARVRQAAGSDPRVRLLGSVWDNELLDTLYAHAITYLHGHSVGGTNPSLLRAMGAGAPVTAYDVVFNREVAGSAGVWFSGPDGVAHACEAAERDPVATAERGRAGQADVAARYRWEDVADRYEALAEELLSRRRGR
ncbi:MAG TPA: glycosyltransferase [Motilibacterales bacterium]|nr:glycosyltransferase [Motilibacterales bacterium]